jgi:transcriptional regulator with XRE-family HTH domain
VNIGERIRATRIARDIKQVDLARAVHIQPQGLWRIEKGIVTNPGIELVDKLATELGVSTDFLIRGEEQAEPEPIAS